VLYPNHPPQKGTKKAARPNARDNYKATGAAGEKEVKKRLGQVSKVSQRLTRQETTEIPETEGTQLVFSMSVGSEALHCQSRKQPRVPLEQGKRFSVEATATKLFLKWNSKVRFGRLRLECADLSYQTRDASLPVENARANCYCRRATVSAYPTNKL
jgi:hypothetical protein